MCTDDILEHLTRHNDLPYPLDRVREWVEEGSVDDECVDYNQVLTRILSDDRLQEYGDYIVRRRPPIQTPEEASYAFYPTFDVAMSLAAEIVACAGESDGPCLYSLSQLVRDLYLSPYRVPPIGMTSCTYIKELYEILQLDSRLEWQVGQLMHDSSDQIQTASQFDHDWGDMWTSEITCQKSRELFDPNGEDCPACAGDLTADILGAVDSPDDMKLSSLLEFPSPLLESEPLPPELGLLSASVGININSFPAMSDFIDDDTCSQDNSLAMTTTMMSLQLSDPGDS
jgi:hypothetical protein